MPKNLVRPCWSEGQKVQGQVTSTMEIEASKSLISHEYDILRHSKILQAFKEMDSLHENLILELQDIQRHKLDCFRRLNSEEHIQHRSFEQKLMEEWMNLEKKKLDSCRKLILDEGIHSLVSRPGRPHLDSTKYLEDDSQFNPTESLIVCKSSKTTVFKENPVNCSSMNSTRHPRSMKTTGQSISNLSDLSDLNSRFEALKIALDPKSSGFILNAKSPPKSRPVAVERTAEMPSHTNSSYNPFEPISPGDLTGIFRASVAKHPTGLDISNPPQPDPVNGRVSFNSWASPRAHPLTKPATTNRGPSCPRLQVPFWMRHHGAASPRQPVSAAARGAPSQQLDDTVTARARNAPLAREGLARRRGGDDVPATGRTNIRPAPFRQRSVSVGSFGTGGGGRSAAAAAADSQWSESSSEFDADPEEAEHAAIMRRIDQSGDWEQAPAEPELLMI
jgi:hypothetical protein